MQRKYHTMKKLLYGRQRAKLTTACQRTNAAHFLVTKDNSVKSDTTGRDSKFSDLRSRKLQGYAYSDFEPNILIEDAYRASGDKSLGGHSPLPSAEKGESLDSREFNTLLKVPPVRVALELTRIGPSESHPQWI